MEKKEVEVKKGVRPISYVIGAIYTAIMVLLVAFMYGSAGKWGILAGGRNIDFLVVWAPLTFISIVLMALPQRLRLTPQELTVVYSMSTLGALMPTLNGVIPTIASDIGFGGEFLSGLPLTLGCANPLFVPKNRDAWMNMIYGGKPVPWDLWATPIAWWSTFLFAQSLLFIVTGSLLRRLYIDLENLPYPVATSTYSIVETATLPEARRSRGKWLILGFILSVATTATIWIGLVFPGLGIPSNPIAIDLTPLALLPWVPLYLNFDTFNIAIGYFLPTDILLSTIIFFIILYMIVPPLATGAGVFGPFPAGISQSDFNKFGLGGPYSTLLGGFSVGGAGWVNWGSGSWGYLSMILGCLFATTLWIMFKLRSQIKEGIKRFAASVTGRGGGPTPKEGDLPIRWLGIAFIALFIAYSVLLSAGTYWYVPIWVSFAATALLLFIFGLSFGVARGYYVDNLGYMSFQGYTHIHAYFTMIGLAIGLGVPQSLPNIPENAIISYSFSRLFRDWGTSHRFAAGTVGPRTLELYRLGSITKTRDRDILVASIYGVVIAILISIPLWLWFSYTYGMWVKWSPAHGAAANFSLMWIYMNTFCEGYETRGPIPWTVWLWYLLGGVIAIALYKLRERFPSFPIHPMGLVGLLLGPAMFMPWIIALILKHLTLRVGGARLFNEKGVPIASGLLGGWATIIMISHITLTLRQIGIIT